MDVGLNRNRCIFLDFWWCGLLDNFIYLKSGFGACTIHFGRQMWQFVQFEIVQPRQTLILWIVLLWCCKCDTNPILISSIFHFHTKINSKNKLRSRRSTAIAAPENCSLNGIWQRNGLMSSNIGNQDLNEEFFNKMPRTCTINGRKRKNKNRNRCRENDLVAMHTLNKLQCSCLLHFECERPRHVYGNLRRVLKVCLSSLELFLCVAK